MENLPTSSPAEGTAAVATAAAAADSAALNREVYRIEEDRPADAIDVVVALDRFIRRLEATKVLAIDLAARESAARTTPGTAEALMQKRSCTAELAAALHVSETAAQNLIGESYYLTTYLPRTVEALAAGQISYQHAKVVIDQTAGVDAADTTDLETAALPRAAEITAAQLKRTLRDLRERRHPESIEKREKTAAEQRTLTLDPANDGMSWLSALLPSPQARAIFDRIDKSVRVRSTDDPRGISQRRADAFATVLLADDDLTATIFDGIDAGNDRVPTIDTDSFVKDFRGIRPEVAVMVPVLSLLGLDNTPATLEGIAPMSAERARILAAHAPSFIRILTHPETGVVLSVGRQRHPVPKDLRRWVNIRDVVCRAIGCWQPASRCDIDHTDEWQHGGHTEWCNLACLCEKHHRLKTETDWNYQHDPTGDGTLHWTTPSKRRYTTYPGTELPGTGRPNTGPPEES